MISKSYIVENNDNFFLSNNSILFYGENLGLKKDFKDKIKKLHRQSQLVNLYQDDILKKIRILEIEISNNSLFNEKKIIFIDQASEKIFPILEQALENIGENKIIIFSDILEKKSKLRSFYEKSKVFQTIPCYPDDGLSIKKIILKQLKGFEGLTTHNINLIIDNSNLDRIKLKNELDKIIVYFQNKKIDAEKLETLLDIKINENFNTLKDEVFNGNKIKTNKLLSDTVLENDKNVYYLTLINQRLNKLAELTKLSEESNIEEAMNRMKPPIFWKDKPNIMMQTKKWNKKNISSVLEKTYKLEIEIKSNADINKSILMKKLLIDMCEIANASSANLR